MSSRIQSFHKTLINFRVGSLIALLVLSVAACEHAYIVHSESAAGDKSDPIPSISIDIYAEYESTIGDLTTSYMVQPFSQELKGDGICLSGGGYRAMLFHAGVLWRINEAGALQQIPSISGVSGGAITAAKLVTEWSNLGFDTQGVATRYQEIVIDPLRALARKTIDKSSILEGAATPVSIPNRLTAKYNKHLYNDKKLRELPNGNNIPRLIILATNLNSRHAWFFSPTIMGDNFYGFYEPGNVDLAVAVAASSAYPPFLAPVVLDISDIDPLPLISETEDNPPMEVGRHEELRAELEDEQLIYRDSTDGRVLLVDGGILDNLGGAGCINQFSGTGGLFSDASVTNVPFRKIYAENWLGITLGMVELIYDRAERSSKKEHGYDPYRFMSDSNLRKGMVENKPIFITLDNFPYTEQLLDAPSTKDLENTFDANEFNHQESLRTLRRLARQETRLAKLDNCVQEALIQWCPRRILNSRRNRCLKKSVAV